MGRVPKLCAPLAVWVSSRLFAFLSLPHGPCWVPSLVLAHAQALVHEHSRVAAYFGSLMNMRPLDYLPSRWRLTCARCDQTTQLTDVALGRANTRTCLNCFSAMTFCLWVGGWMSRWVGRKHARLAPKRSRI